MSFFVIRLANWARDKCDSDKTIGKIIEIIYGIIVAPEFQSAINLIASATLGAFIMFNKKLNLKFIVVFALVYLFFLLSTYICNTYRKIKNAQIAVNEEIVEFFNDSILSLFNKQIDTTDNIEHKSLKQINNYLKSTNVIDLSFNVCESIRKVLLKIKNSGSDFKVQIFVRNISNSESSTKDTYSMIAYSPQRKRPDLFWDQEFDLNEYREKLGTEIDYSSDEFKKKTKQLGIPCHAWPFLYSRAEPLCIAGEQVDEYYINCNRKKPTRLHITIPCEIKENVLMAIQITSKKADALCPVKNLEEYVYELNDKIFETYRLLLSLNHSIQKNNEIIKKAIDNIS